MTDSIGELLLPPLPDILQLERRYQSPSVKFGVVSTLVWSVEQGLGNGDVLNLEVPRVQRVGTRMVVQGGSVVPSIVKAI